MKFSFFYFLLFGIFSFQHTIVASFSNNVVRLPDPPDHCGISYAEAPYAKIIGSFKVHRGQFPWMVTIGADTSHLKDPNIPNPLWSCAGSLITPNHVLTAAYCVDWNDVLADYVRINTLKPYEEVGFQGNITDIFIHTNYTPLLVGNDIAVLRIEWENETVADLIRQATTINPICLPKSGQMRRNSFEKYHPFVAGWGASVYEKRHQADATIDLQAVQIPVWPQKLCRIKLRQLQIRTNNDNNMCAGYYQNRRSKKRRDFCQRDAGGPLMLPQLVNGVTRFYQIGIVSGISTGCGRPGIPGIYTRVGNYMDWIEEVINVPPKTDN